MEELIKFQPISCTVYDVKEEKYYGELELNGTLTVATSGSNMDLLYSVVADGDVDSWTGWLIDQEGSDY